MRELSSDPRDTLAQEIALLVVNAESADGRGTVAGVAQTQEDAAADCKQRTAV